MLKKLKSWILPKEIDFFGSLSHQSMAISAIITELSNFYLESSSQDSGAIFDTIEKAKQIRKVNIQELNSTFITPVDKEAISRATAALHWIGLSVKHLVVELNTYQIYNLKDYRKMFEILQQEMNDLTEGFKLLSSKKYDQIIHQVNLVIHHDDSLIKEYTVLLEKLFNETDLKHILEHKEVLSQIKEISKRIHKCGNLLEDIVFKMN